MTRKPGQSPNTKPSHFLQTVQLPPLEDRKAYGLLTAITGAISSGVVVINDQGQVIFANPLAAAWLGLVKLEPENGGFHQNHWDCPDHAAQSLVAKLIGYCQLAQKGPDRFVFEYNLIRSAEGPRLMSVEISFSAGDANGTDNFLIASLNDISEQKRADIELRDSEEMYRTLFEHAGFGIALIDPQTGKRVAFNRKLYERLGYTREEYEKLTLYDLQYDSEAGSVREKMNRIFEQKALIFEERQRTKEGDMRHVLVSAVPITIGGKNLIHAISLDITDRKQVEEALKAKTEELDQYFNNSLDLLCIADSDGTFRRLNPQW